MGAGNPSAGQSGGGRRTGFGQNQPGAPGFPRNVAAGGYPSQQGQQGAPWGGVQQPRGGMGAPMGGVQQPRGGIAGVARSMSQGLGGPRPTQRVPPRVQYRANRVNQDAIAQHGQPAVQDFYRQVQGNRVNQDAIAQHGEQAVRDYYNALNQRR